MPHFLIRGGKKLNGTVVIPGAKNAALKMLCAALLTPEKCVIKNIPRIGDVETLLQIFRDIGVLVKENWKEKTVEIQAKKIDLVALEKNELVKKIRASLLLIGPILSRTGRIKIMTPGGCIIGARSHQLHLDAFETLGVRILRDDDFIELSFEKKKIATRQILLPEASVTGTENLAIFLTGQMEKTDIYFTAAEPHVVALLDMLRSMGAKISGAGTHHITIEGTKKIRGGIFSVPPDNILVGTYAVAAIITRGSVRISPVNHAELFSFYGILKRLGANFLMEKDALVIEPCKKLQSITKVKTAIFPGFPTDLQSPVGVLLTQCEGKSLLFETLFENRLTYLNELEKMGAKIKILNPHQAKITGISSLKGAEVVSWDLRAGAAVVLAGLIAKGKTKVSQINYIDRGYENFVETLQSLGADIKRVK